MIRVRTIAAGLAAFLSVSAAFAEPRLAPGKPLEGTLPLNSRSSVTYALTLPEDVAAVVISLRASAVLSLHLHPAEAEQAADAPGIGTVINAEEYSQILVANRYADPDLEPGEFLIELSYDAAEMPTVEGKQVSDVHYTLNARFVPESPFNEVEAGKSVAASTGMENGGVAIFHVKLPESAKVLRLDLTDTDEDLQLLASPGAVPRTQAAAAAQSLTSRGRESLVLPLASAKEAFVVVFRALVGEVSAKFRLCTRLSQDPPPELLALPALPELPAATPALARAMRATVEILLDDGGGSGTLIGERGLILTNAHVVESPSVSGKEAPPVAVGATFSLERPTVELFLAKVLKIDPVRDLALLQIVTGLYGQPIPKDYRFPGLTLRWAACDEVKVGETLTQIGYPAVGGSESRSTISVTRSALAGFVTHPNGRAIKVGGGIFPGNSGGGSYNEAGEFIGLPTALVGGAEDGGSMGYVHPASLMPEDWRAFIAERMK